MRLVARPPRPHCAKRAYSLSLGGNAPKGLHDLLPADHHRHDHVVRAGAKLAQTYGYEKVSTPIMEHTDVFSRSLGDDSDVVMKEMYSFKDVSGQDLTLRPEGTAGIVRALLSHKLIRHLPQRLYYHGPMFRYEKPQRGRARQFGIESFGVGHPSAEVEAIAYGHRFLEEVGLNGGFTLELSSLGDIESRNKYRTVLKDYLDAHKTQLSPESVARVERGSVLRVLDSKEVVDQPLIKGAPRIDAHYTPAAKERFLEVQEGLKAAKVPFIVNPLLMRGLDYYSHSIWECVSQHPSLVGQRTLLAGGRYDDLLNVLRGGRGDPVPSIGWAAGIERLCLVLKDFTPPKSVRPVALIVVRNESQDSYVKSPVARQAIALMEELRRANFPVLYFATGGASKQLQKALASAVPPFAALFLGEDEVAQRCVQLKVLDTQTQSVCKWEGLTLKLQEVHDRV